MKRILSCLLAITLIFSVAFAMAACQEKINLASSTTTMEHEPSIIFSTTTTATSQPSNEGIVEFSGSLSTTTFDTKQDAVTGFLSEQINGAATESVFVSYETTRELSESEVAAINLTATEKADFISAEEGTVTYTDDGKNMQRSLFILTFTEYFKYYITGEYEIGDTLTQTDFQQIARSDLLSNVTVTGTFSHKVGDEISSTTITIKSTVDALLYKEDADSYFIEHLFVKTENSIAQYERVVSGDYDSGYIPSETSVTTMTEALESVIFAAQGDHSYLAFSENGFVLREDKRQTYFDDYVIKYDLSSYGTFELVDCNCEFIFKDNKILEMIHYNNGKTTDGETTAIENVSFVFSDYGTTTLDIPALP